MKLEKFFDKFDQLAEAPNAMTKMRELVLDLAAKGSWLSNAQTMSKHPIWLSVSRATLNCY